MVKLEKISIQGFKSFKKKVSIPFPSGFSAVTGPNGAGKTNVLDSIAFVLGKLSSKAMRAKRTHELIFHGSKKKSGSDYAIVTLHLDNKDKVLPLKERDVIISRRINRKGVSTYRINGKVSTRQQIVDIFSQAGLHPDGHNIIQQGDVNNIVEMDAVQRRQIIDEISGIAEYDDKKKKAEKELERIDEKVKEAEIVLQEKESIMERLQKDYEAAMEYKRLEQELKNVRMAIIWKSYSKSKDDLQEIIKKIDEKTLESDSCEKKVKELDEELAKVEEKLEDLTKEVIKASDEINVSKKIMKLRSDVEIKREKLESNLREIERLESMISRLQSMDRSHNPAVKAVLGRKGVCGTLSSLIIVPKQYTTAAEVAAGARKHDVVVDTTTIAVSCVKYLKENRIGRARFLPLDKIQAPAKRPLPVGAIGWLSELIHHDPKYTPAVDFVFATTAVVNDINRAKEISKKNRVRMVTLDGDLMETSGAITGGFYKARKSAGSDITAYMEQKKKLEVANKDLEDAIARIDSELDKLADKEKKTKSVTFEKDRISIDERLKKIREERREIYEKRLILQQEIGKLNIQKARIEAHFDNLKVQWESDEKSKELEKELKPYLEKGTGTLRQSEKEAVISINNLGPINMKAIEDFSTFREEFDEFREKVDKIVTERSSILDTLDKVETKRISTFNDTMSHISKHFKTVYKTLTGGEADLSLEDPKSLESGLLVRAQPKDKKLLSIDSMSGGEKTLTAFAFLFAIQRYRPSPFYVLDEADASLDKANTKKIVDLIKSQTKDAQFIIISHNDTLVKEADQIYGVTMEDGESKIFSVHLPEEVDKRAARSMAKNN